MKNTLLMKIKNIKRNQPKEGFCFKEGVKIGIFPE